MIGQVRQPNFQQIILRQLGLNKWDCVGHKVDELFCFQFMAKSESGKPKVDDEVEACLNFQASQKSVYLHEYLPNIPTEFNQDRTSTTNILFYGSGSNPEWTPK